MSLINFFSFNSPNGWGISRKVNLFVNQSGIKKWLKEKISSCFLIFLCNLIFILFILSPSPFNSEFRGWQLRENFPQKTSLEEISLSYNGGKDCLVLLILFLCAIAMSPVRNYTSTTNLHLPRRIKSVYITAQHPFPEVDAFVEKCESTYRLDLVRYAMPMKAAFTRYLDEHKTIKAILVGTRRTDPHGKLLTHFDETDGGWPRFMRIHPIIDWKYTEIWAVRTISFRRIVKAWKFK